MKSSRAEYCGVVTAVLVRQPDIPVRRVMKGPLRLKSVFESMAGLSTVVVWRLVGTLTQGSVRILRSDSPSQPTAEQHAVVVMCANPLKDGLRTPLKILDGDLGISLKPFRNVTSFAEDAEIR